ncbi:MAG: hypothetical protein WAQ98_32200 [Blastocatellia bacterium]
MLSKLKFSKNNTSSNNTNFIDFEMLPAERKSRPAVAMCMGCTSCCCCCCCVHTIGGIAGAVIATKVASNAVNPQFMAGQRTKYNYNQQNNPTTNAQESVKKVTMAYWVTLGILSAVSFLITFILASNIELTVIAYFGVVLPIIQIATLVISLLALLAVPDRNTAFKALLKIAAGSIAGIILGIMVMITGAIVLGVF